ncbi:ATP-binding protein, partial [Ralstonia pickettii]|uniref:ATP-binding protein n=1 Tax=Ralstonia pickettii TaxID=329 RepID=UPI002175E735
LTSVCGFASMLFSGFPGLVQLGLYSIVGLTAAALVTRFVLPHLRGEHVAIRDVSRIGAVLARAADAANDAKSAFLATMSHEIRTPLNAILGNLELIGREPLADSQRERLHTVEDASSVLLDLINDILDLSKIEAGQMTIEAIPFDLAETVRQTGAMFEPLAAAKGLQFDVFVDDALASRYVGDPTRIRQIAANLVGNAIKFTNHGEITLEVYLRDDTNPESPIAIGVSDTGIGMTDAQRAALFRPFTQADTSITRRYGGTGLGLFIAQRIVGAMGGELAVASQPGVGTSFSFAIVAPAVGHVLVPASELVRRFHAADEVVPGGTAPAMGCPPDDALDALIRLAGNGQ